MLFFVRNSSQRARCVQAHCHGVTTSLRSSTSQAVCASHFPSVVSKPCSKTSHRQADQVEQAPYEQFLECQKKDQHWLDFAANLVRFFSVAERMASSIRKNAALFPGHNRTAMIHRQL